MMKFLCIPRHEPHKVAIICTDGRKLTYLEELRAHPNQLIRTDIVLINEFVNNRVVKQHTIHAGNNGLVGPIHLLDDETLKWAKLERLRIISVCEQYPEWEVYIRS